MTEHTVRPRNPDHRVTVGWNAKLQSFWFKVWDKKADRIVTWVGLQQRELPETIDLKKRMHRYAYFNNELGERLKADRAAGKVAS